MNINVNDITITSIETISLFDAADGAFKFTLDELQNVTIAQSEEKTDITGKQGRKLGSLKRNKAVTISGTNGLVSAGLMELQTGGKFEVKDTTVLWADYLTVSGNQAKTNFKAVGTEGNEIEHVHIKDASGVVIKTLTQAATAATGSFAYNPESLVITFAEGEVEDGAEIVVFYKRKINAAVLENKSDNYSGKGTMYIDAIGEDPCANTYHVQLYFPKADFNGNFELAMGDSQTVHAFEAEALAGACGAGGTYFTYTVFGAEAADAA